MENAIELVTRDGTNLEAKAEAEMAPILKRAAEYVVADEQTYLDADLVIKTIREKVKEREAELLPPKEAATKAWKAMCALVKKYIDDPLEACKTLDRKRYAWKKAEDKKREDKAEADRRAEQKRVDAEKLELAARLDTAGMKEQATQVLDAPSAPVSVPDPVKVETVQGQSQIEHWTATIVNPDLVPREFCIPSQAKLNEYARLMKGRAATPGVKYEDVGKTTRRGS